MGIEVKEAEEVKEAVVEVPEVELVSQDGLTDEEAAMADKLGVKRGEQSEQPKPESKDNIDEKKEEVAEEKHPSFEDIDKNKDLLKKYNKNEQALYWKYKSDKRKRQEAEEKVNEFKAEAELTKIREKSYKERIDRAIQLLTDENKELTASDILKILDSQDAKEEHREPDEKVIQQKQAEKFKARVDFMEEMGRQQHEDFDNLIELAKEVVAATPRYQKLFQQMLNDDNIDPQEVIDEVVEVARKNPKYNQGKKASTTEKEKVEKAIKNSEKKVSSASISAGSGRVIPEDELTIEQAAKLSNEQWRKLKKETRDRLSRL